jgi:dephospho-CoA kinase
MLIVGLSGSIGMGKSAIAARFRARGIAVFDADAEVHRLYEGEAAQLIALAFPGTVTAGRVDRGRLADVLAADPEAFLRLEKIVHPLVTKAERDFLRAEARRGATIAVLEIPLLFETGLEAKVDAVVVASASAETQRERVLARPGMSAARLEILLNRQMPGAEKEARADFIVDTNGSLAESERQVDAIIDALRERTGDAYERHWA